MVVWLFYARDEDKAQLFSFVNHFFFAELSSYYFTICTEHWSIYKYYKHITIIASNKAYYALFNVHDFLFKKFQVTTYMFVKDKDQLPYKLGRDFLIQCPGLSLQAPKSQYYVEKKGESYFVMWDFLLFIWNNYLFNKKYLTACEFYYCL